MMSPRLSIALWPERSGGRKSPCPAPRQLHVERLEDRRLLSIDLVSIAPGVSASGGNGWSADVSTSQDGRYVAFCSSASNLVPADLNNTSDVFVRDLWAEATTLVSTGSLGRQGDFHSADPSVSDDGRYAAFISDATNLVADDTNGNCDVFVKDLWTGATARPAPDGSRWRDAGMPAQSSRSPIRSSLCLPPPSTSSIWKNW